MFWEEVVVDAADPQALGRWWVEALGWVVVDDGEEFEIAPEQGSHPTVLFVRVPEPKTVKDRLHLDFRPGPGRTRDEEVARLEGLGAVRVDLGQGDASWVPMTDPEGNEFCVLSPRAG